MVKSVALSIPPLKAIISQIQFLKIYGSNISKPRILISGFRKGDTWAKRIEVKLY